MSPVDLHNVLGVANPLRRWRVHNHVTQAQLAAALDVHPSQVSQWEKRRAVPTLECYSRLHRHTGISLHVLLRFFVPPPAVPFREGVVMQFPGQRNP